LSNPLAIRLYCLRFVFVFAVDLEMELAIHAIHAGHADVSSHRATKPVPRWHHLDLEIICACQGKLGACSVHAVVKHQAPPDAEGRLRLDLRLCSRPCSAICLSVWSRFLSPI
jgi:hypothetical protein